MRALMGAGGALIMPATLSIITNVFPRERQVAGARGVAAASIGSAHAVAEQLPAPLREGVLNASGSAFKEARSRKTATAAA